jgi:hypothetical protein
MKKILIVLACVVAAGLAIAGAGMFLPQNHVATRTATIAAPPEKVSDDGKGTRFIEKSGDGEILFRIEVLEPNTRMVTRIADPTLPFGGTWTFDLKPNGASTDLTITEHGEVYNVFFRTMQKLFFPPTKTIDTYLDDLKKHLANQ